MTNASTKALDDLLDADGAASIEITREDGVVVGVATVTEDGDEIACYQDGDLNTALVAAASLVPEPRSGHGPGGHAGAARYTRS